VFNDWYISSGHKPIRLRLHSVTVTGFCEKGVSFEDEEIVQAELANKHAADVDPILEAISRITGKNLTPTSFSQNASSSVSSVHATAEGFTQIMPGENNNTSKTESENKTAPAPPPINQ